MRARLMLLVAMVGLVGVVPSAAAQDPDEVADAIEEVFAPWKDLGLDPLGELQPEDVPAVQQPDYWRFPVFNQYFGTNLTNGIDNRSSVTTGTGPNGEPWLYVGTSAEQIQTFDARNPTTPLAGRTFGSGSFQNLSGITFARGEVFALDQGAKPENARIQVFTADGKFKRTLPVVNPGGLATMTGIDVAHGEIWITGEICGGALGIVQILDATTGLLKGITPTVSYTPTGDPLHPCDEPYDPSAWWDISAIPEYQAAIAQFRLLNRGLFAAFTLPDPELGCPRCFRRLWQEGSEGVAGMKWLLTVDGTDRTHRGTGITEFSVDPNAINGDPYLQERRRWFPQQASVVPQQSSDAVGVRDIAYQNRETRIDWKGQLSEHEWMRGNRCLKYVVSDADIYATGMRGEHWYELARNFGHIEMWLRREGGSYQQIRFNQTRADGTTAIDLLSSTEPAGDMCINTGLRASDEYSLMLKAFVNNGTKVVTIENPVLKLDNTLPTGTLNSVARWVTGTVALGGSMTDPHSGPRDWQHQVLVGGVWRNNCGRMIAESNAAGFPCLWDTTTVGDGQYTLSAELRDKVTDPYGGPNVGRAPNVITSVDNTPPSVSVGGLLAERADGQLIWHGETAELTSSASDVTSGTVRLRTVIDGVEVQSKQQGCATGGCGLTGDTFVFDAAQYGEGEHTVEVIATDQVGREASRQWVVSVKESPPDAPDESATDPYDLPSGPPDPPEDASREAPLDDGDMAGGRGNQAGAQLQCSVSDPYIVNHHFDYAPTFLAATSIQAPAVGPPTPDVAVATYLMSTVTLPHITPTAFTRLGGDDSNAVYVAYVDGAVRARLDLVRTGSAWVVTWFEACSEFVDSYLKER